MGLMQFFLGRFRLGVYGHNVVLPWEIQTRSRRVTLQNDLIVGVYKNFMMDDLDDLSGHWQCTLEILRPIN